MVGGLTGADSTISGSSIVGGVITSNCSDPRGWAPLMKGSLDEEDSLSVFPQYRWIRGFSISLRVARMLLIEDEESIFRLLANR